MHPEPDELAAAASGEPDAAMAAHLRSCDDCRIEYEEFLAAATQVRASATRLELERPPSSVWAGIHRELSLDDRLASDPFDAEGTARSAAPIRAAAGTPVPPARSAWRWWGTVAAAVVIGVVAGVAIGTSLSSRSPAETLVAEARLDPLPGWIAEGSAVVEESSEGRRTILVQVDGDTVPGQLREVWLLSEDATTGLVSLGFLDGASGRFAVPPGIDLTEFPLVDVSSEPANGDPAHSGDSIVRGQLRGA
ncbi:anti-sigma factor domain-containing protein [Agromyces laixinhei]|uniref:anti-sigma factor domain-containing protein n=1 Tax=Agromyces laixinhei TaxID=2585717 RepID=UPI0012ECEEE6|nr:anti-sigma factor [Agromyces laixinhei]